MIVHGKSHLRGHQVESKGNKIHLLLLGLKILSEIEVERQVLQFIVLSKRSNHGLCCSIDGCKRLREQKLWRSFRVEGE